MQIVGNAQSAMPHGGPLMLRGTLDRHDNRFLNLDVIDSGIGMSPDVAKQAASPFFTTKECVPFSGMGLSAVAGFAARSGGQMSISSAVGLGTTIRMFLPAVAALATDREGTRRGESVVPRDRKITSSAILGKIVSMSSRKRARHPQCSSELIFIAMPSCGLV